MSLMFLSRSRNKKSVVPLSHVSATTLAPGNLIPISIVRVLAGDDLSFTPSTFVQAFPMKAPLINGFHICYEYFFVPDRLYHLGLLLNDKGLTANPDDVVFPQIREDRNTYFVEYGGTDCILLGETAPSAIQLASLGRVTVAPGSLLDYCGLPVGYTSMMVDNNALTFSALKALGYNDIYYHYYANQQIDSFPTAFYDTKMDLSIGEAEFVFQIPLDRIRDLLDTVKSSRTPNDALKQWITDTSLSGSGIPLQEVPMDWQFLCSRRSIYQRCLKPYYLEAWLKTAGILEDSVEVDVENNSVKFKNVRDASHIERWLMLAGAGDASYADYLNAQFDVSKLQNTSIPVFLGSDRQFLGSRVIYQTTGAADAASPLGAFAGQSSDGNKFKKRTYHFGENGHFYVIASLVPDTIYYRGLDPFLMEKTLGDVYTPALDNISMEPLMKHEADALPYGKTIGSNSDGVELFPSIGPDSPALGYVPAWSRYMQVVSRAHGRLTTDLKYWLLPREYLSSASFPQLDTIYNVIEESAGTLALGSEEAEAVLALLENLRGETTVSPYIFSHMYNNVFADISNHAQNFVLTFSCDMSAYREKSKVNIPNTI